MSDSFWWRVPKGQRAGAVYKYVFALDQSMRQRRAENALNARLYAGREVMGIGGQFRTTPTWLGQGTHGTMENIIFSVCDTALALIAGTRPVPTFMTEGGEWKVQRRAKKFGQYVMGLYEMLGIYALAVACFLDAIVLGMGCIKIFALDGKPGAERVLIDDIYVDEFEARNGCPRQMHQKRYVDKSILAEMYPKMAQQIEEAQPYFESNQPRGPQLTNHNMVEVWESWHLPSCEGGKDGLHCITIKSAVLFEEAWNKDHFPFVFMNWTKPQVGFYAQGIVEPLTMLQLSLNRLNRFIRKCQQLIAVPRVFGDFDQRTMDKALTDEIATFTRTLGGKAPVFYTPQALTAETYNERDRTVERAFALAGVSEMHAQGQKQPGVESGVAIRAVMDIQAGRFGIRTQGFEDFHKDIAKLLVETATDIHQNDEEANLEVSFTDEKRKFTSTIAWKDVNPGEDVFTIRCEASSYVSRTPAGVIQDALDKLQMGILDRDQFLHAVNHPDAQRINDLKDAAMEDLEALLENLEEGNWENPEPFQNLTKGIEMVQQNYLRIRRFKQSKERDVVLELHRRWVDNAQSMIEDAAAAATPPPMPGAMPGAVGPQMGMPGAPPQGLVPGAPLPGAGMPLPPMAA